MFSVEFPKLLSIIYTKVMFEQAACNHSATLQDNGRRALGSRQT